jgi:hypothetical protein
VVGGLVVVGGSVVVATVVELSSLGTSEGETVGVFEAVAAGEEGVVGVRRVTFPPVRIVSDSSSNSPNDASPSANRTCAAPAPNSPTSNTTSNTSIRRRSKPSADVAGVPD